MQMEYVPVGLVAQSLRAFVGAKQTNNKHIDGTFVKVH